MCFVITLMHVLPSNAPYLIKALRRGGLFCTLKGNLEGYLGTSILESDLRNNLFMMIDFYSSAFSFFESEISPIGIVLTDAIDRVAYDHSTLGPFSFPPSPDFPAEEPTYEIAKSTSAEFIAEVENEELVRN